jgi:hypothetical protein
MDFVSKPPKAAFESTFGGNFFGQTSEEYPRIEASQLLSWVFDLDLLIIIYKNK